MNKRQKSIIVTCSNCGENVKKYVSQLRPGQKFFYCSNQCKAEHLKTLLLGENNPNFNKKWNSEQRQNQSKIMRERFKDPIARYKAGSSNRNKKLPETSQKLKEYYKTHPPCMLGKKHTEQAKQKMSLAQKIITNTNEFKEKVRLTNEKNGVWVPKEQKSDFKIYYELANWKKRMFDLITDQKQLEKLKIFGVFSTKNNRTGIVRDHMYSRHSGFDNGVFPEILRHPCNCELLTALENSRKRKTRYIDADSQTLEQLFNRIITYSGKWYEQELVCKLIEDYKNGLRWRNPFKNE